jgi:hypothetical protein
MQDFYNIPGFIRKHDDKSGKTVLVQLTNDQWEVIEEALDKDDGLVDADVIMKEMKITKKTLSNLISSGKIKRWMYTILPNGLKKFFYRKVMGLENNG